MAAILAANVTHTVTQSRKSEDGRLVQSVTLTFGDGALTYPTGGVPLTLGKLGFPTVVESFQVVDDGGAGYLLSYDIVNNKLKFLVAPAQTHTHDLLLKNAAVADGATTRVNAGANLLGANTGGDLTVTGSGANGGVVSKTLAAAVHTELANTVAPAAQTIKILAIGW